MSRLWVTGYRSYEIGTFGDKDPKIEVIKYAIKCALKDEIERGLEWVITGGQLGVEQWTVAVVDELKSEFPNLKVAMMLPFKDFGNQWADNNQEKLKLLRAKSDFVDSVSNIPYEGPRQLQNYQNFMLEHTDAALLIYDTEFEAKTTFDYNIIKNKQEQAPYPLTLVDMLNLQDYATEYEELNSEKHDFSE
ncbi:DUF1273 domain-containing protein [Leuconostoc carnosum]|uniref:DUF1273 domain-containing protein n=1 Tax=Leuconostoc carnosum TaxID=1252 RepID=UPI00345C8BDA